MFAYALTFIACLSGAPDRCQTVQIPWDGSLQQCMLFGQQAAAEWQGQHPGWAMRRGYRCESGSGA